MNLIGNALNLKNKLTIAIITGTALSAKYMTITQRTILHK